MHILKYYIFGYTKKKEFTLKQIKLLEFIKLPHQTLNKVHSTALYLLNPRRPSKAGALAANAASYL